MLRRLLLTVVLVGVGVAFAAPGDDGYVDPACAATHLDVWIDYVAGIGRTDDGDADSNPYTYECSVGGVTYRGTIEHINAAVTSMGPPWDDRMLGMTESNSPVMFFTESSGASTLKFAGTTITYFRLLGTANLLSGNCTYEGRSLNGGYYYVATPDVGAFGCEDGEWETAKGLYQIYLQPVFTLKDALENVAAFVSLDYFKTKVELAFYGALMDTSNYPDGWEGPGGEDGDEDGGGVDYPKDGETGCRILDLFCWARWAFVPNLDHGSAFGSLRSQLMTKVPFGWAEWFTPGNASFSPDSDAEFVINLHNLCIKGIGPGPGGNGFCPPNLDLSAQAPYQWWAEHGRPALYMIFVTLFWWAAFRRILS